MRCRALTAAPISLKLLVRMRIQFSSSAYAGSVSKEEQSPLSFFIGKEEMAEAARDVQN
jgi:hypothetical protein